jgi:hypothetical protein
VNSSPSCAALEKYLAPKPQDTDEAEAEKLAARFGAAIGEDTYVEGGDITWDGGYSFELGPVERFLLVLSLRGGALVLDQNGVVYTVSSRGVALIDYETGRLEPVSDAVARAVVERLSVPCWRHRGKFVKPCAACDRDRAARDARVEGAYPSP